MKNTHLVLSIAAFLLCFVTAPVSAQQMTSGNGFVPINQVSGLTNFNQAPTGNPNGYGNQSAQFSQAGGFAPQNMLPGSVAPMGNQGEPAFDQGYNQSNLNALSPYEQQELALKESRMLQELETIKNRDEKSQGFRSADSSGFVEEGYAERSRRPGGGGFKKAMGKLGKFVARTTEMAAPAGAYVGSMFVMRAAFGPPATFMPIATPGGTAFIPIQGR